MSFLTSMSRRSPWLALALVATVAVLYLSGVAWANHRDLIPSYERTRPGAVVTVGEESYRLVALHSTREIGSNDGGFPDEAEDGTRFVIAELEYTARGTLEKPRCELPLIVEGLSFEPQLVLADRDLPNDCAGAIPGRPWRFELAYQVPDRYADVWGVGVDVDPEIPGGRPIQVLQPG